MPVGSGLSRQPNALSPGRPVPTVIRVAVYGTLKRGCSHHHYLRGARFLGEDRLANLRLYDLGSYPAAKRGPSARIDVEVFEISAARFTKLDRLEEYRPAAPRTGLYDRELFPTRFGPAWVYLYNPGVRGRRCIRSGRW